MFDKPREPEQLDRRERLMLHSHAISELLQQLEDGGHLTGDQVVPIYAQLALLNAKLREVARG